MNFLAHLWLADRLGEDLAGAVLGDVVRGRLDGRFPEPLERSIRLHRRIDALTDAHPLVTQARAAFPAPGRRYAGVLLDLLYDHALALDWHTFSHEPLSAFAHRSAHRVAAAADWFAAADAPTPRSSLFARLLESYETEAGMDAAVRRIERRVSRPKAWRATGADWRGHVAGARQDVARLLPELLATLREGF